MNAGNRPWLREWGGVNMKALSLAGIALIAVLGDAATAADLPIAPPPVTPVYRTPQYWTGCYVGANVGTGWSRAGVTDSTNQFGFGIGGADLGTQQTAGLIGGVQGGCDYQVGSFVFGIQGMFDGSTMKGNTIWQANPSFRNNGKHPVVRDVDRTRRLHLRPGRDDLRQGRPRDDAPRLQPGPFQCRPRNRKLDGVRLDRRRRGRMDHRRNLVDVGRICLSGIRTPERDL